MLFSIVRHACYDWLRKNRVLVTTPLADDPDLEQIGEATADVGLVAGGVIGASRRTLSQTSAWPEPGVMKAPAPGRTVAAVIRSPA